MDWRSAVLVTGIGGLGVEAQYKRVVQVTRLHMKVREALRCWNSALWLASSLNAA